MKIEIRNIEKEVLFDAEAKQLTGTLFLDGKSAGPITIIKGNGFNTHEQICVIDRKIFKGPEHIARSNKEGALDQNSLFANDNRRQIQNFNHGLQKRMADQLLIAKDDNTIVSLKLNIKISWALAQPEGDKRLVKLIRSQVLPELKPGYRFLNNNISPSILLKAGIKNGIPVPKQNISRRSKRNFYI